MTPILPIFLDFEGVLRVGGDAFHRAPLLLAPLLSAEAIGLAPALIIASTHRLSHSWEHLAALVDRDAPGLGRFFSGSTPFGPRCSSTPDDFHAYSDAPRFFETQAWLKEHAIPDHGRWIAIDDAPHLYGGALRLPEQLILCEGRLGFTLLQAQALSLRFDAIARADASRA